MVRDFPVCPSNSNGTLTNYSRVGIGLVRGRYKQPALRLRVHALLSFFTRAHASKGLPDNPMVIVSAVKRTKKKQQPGPVEAVSKVLVHPDPRVRLLVRLFADAGLRRIEAVSARTENIIDDSRVEA